MAALTNVPVLLLSVAAIPGSFAIARLGARGAFVASAWVIAIAAALRGVGPSTPVLFAATICMGAGIAAAQTALPALVRSWYPNAIAAATSVWANGLLCGEAFSAALTIPMLPLLGGSWEAALAVWSIPVVASAIAFAAVPPPAHVEPAVSPLWFPDFRDGRVWRIGIFQGAASLTYFGANTFIPDFLHAANRPELVGPALAALNIGQLPASLILGLVPLRVLARSETAIFVALLIIAGLVAFEVTSNPVAIIAASTAFGLCAAYVLAFSFALPAFLAHGTEVARVSAGTYTIGYGIAFVTTVLSGALWDATHLPAIAFVPIAGAAAIVLLLGAPLGGAALKAASS